MKTLIFLGVIVIFTVVIGDIVITPNPAIAEYWEYSNATFRFNLAPWPPPCCKWNHSEGELYRHVIVELFVTPSSHYPRRKLCEIEYELGKLKNDTGKCNTYDDRMLDFYPDMSDGVSFTLTEATMYDQGPVELLISYQDRSASGVVELVITETPPAPNITANPPGELKIGDEVELRCWMSWCSPPPSDISWTKTSDYGGYLPVDPEDSKLAGLWIEESWSIVKVYQVTWRDHARPYRCTAKNSVGNNDNSHALVVRHEPHISLLPCQQAGLAVRILEGQNIFFSCEVSAYPSHGNYTIWKKDDELMDFNGTDYIIRTSVPSDSGSYSCSATNDIGSGSDICEIDVLYGARVTLDKENVIVREGGSVEVSCSADANPPPESIAWLFDNNPNFKQDGEILQLTNIQPENAGNYTCQAESVMKPSEGSPVTYIGSKKVNVTVEYKARWKTYAWKKYAAEESSTALLQCHCSAYPIPSFYWTRFGSNVTLPVSSDAFVSNLTIENVKPDQYGTYECHVVNAIGNPTFEIELQRPGKPDSAQACHLDKITAYEATLKCINGYNGGRTIWYETSTKNGKNMETETVLEGDMTSTVTMHGFHPNTNYTVYLFARNEFGRSDSSLPVEFQTGDGEAVETGGGTNVGGIVGGVLGSIAILLMIIAFVYFYKRSKNNKANSGYKAKKRQSSFIDYGQTNPTYDDDYKYEYSYKKAAKQPKDDFEVYESDTDEEELKTIANCQPDLWEINRDQVQFHTFVGEGSFTQVWSGYLMKHNMKNGALVAVKIIKGAKPSEREKLLTEIELMKTMEPHPNIISLVACSTKYEPVMMVMEYATNGRLLDYLRQLRSGRASLTLAHLTSCAAQVVNAMHYVSSLKLLHKDLAARSVLLDGDLNCKVADLTVQSGNAGEQDQARICLRWMAPEWLFHNVHTTMSDVWAMGVLLWEIITLGSTPWPGYTGRQVSDALRHGQRMPMPPACPPKWYDMMCDCWHQQPTQRPSWDKLRDALDEDLSRFHSRPQSAMPVTHLMANAMDMVKNLPGEKC